MAVKKMSLPPGFKATVFAGEPFVRQPSAFAIDDRGRVWVAEAYTYPVRAKGEKGKDRILVFEDTKGDGKFDKRTVFMEGFNLISGLEVGFGGVWVGAAPYFMYIPLKDGNEPMPAGKPQILLDGFAYADAHEVFNTFTWGPDGWLYGCHGVVDTSNVGPPGTPDNQRIKMNAGVWRYHPVKHIFERFSEGTSNPWGIDFDEHGQCMTEACVIPHLFHMIQGGHFTRQMGEHFNPYVYDSIKTIADHLHWGGVLDQKTWKPWNLGRSETAFGGGHAHSGLLIYQGDNWPEQYRGKIFMNNIYGSCINMDIPENKGSGFVAHHGQNFINFNDPWALIVNLQTGPDGSVYMIDWYDQLKCYYPNSTVDRRNGRIYKISYGNTKFERVDLASKSNLDLIELLGNKNNWHARHAQRLLQERYSGTNVSPDLRAFFMSKILDPTVNPVTRLRYVWTLSVIDGSAKAEDALTLLKSISAESSDEYILARLIQILSEDPHPSPEMMGLFARLAREDKSPVVRLYLASALQRLPVEDRWEVLAGLYSHAEDAKDHNLPLMA